MSIFNEKYIEIGSQLVAQMIKISNFATHLILAFRSRDSLAILILELNRKFVCDKVITKVSAIFS